MIGHSEVKYKKIALFVKSIKQSWEIDLKDIIKCKLYTEILK